MSKNLVFGVIAILILIGGIGYVAMKQGGGNTSTIPQDISLETGTNVVTTQENTQNATSPAGASVVTGASDTATKGEVKTFTVEGSSFKFVPNEIQVKKGDSVKIVFKNAEGFHDWVLDEFNAKSKQIPAGQTDTVEFVADKTGTFEYYCSVGKHRQQGMVGKLIVE
jgi:plastocyanin